MRTTLLIAALALASLPAAAQDTVTTISQANAMVSEPAANWLAQRSTMPMLSQRGNNMSIITQLGNYNQGSTDQTGGNNTAILTQIGNGNLAALNQYGSNGAITSTQTGNGIGITITQTGNAPSITVTQTRPGR